MEFYIVDAFSEVPFGGNPAGVVFAKENMDPEIMQKIAAEVRFSETAFVRQLDNKTFQVRFFTPAAEVDLCGHATISTFQVLMENGLVKKDETYLMKALAGDLSIFISENHIMMEQADPMIKNTEFDLNVLSSILGIRANEIGAAPRDLKPSVVSTGLWDIMLPVKSDQILNKISPDFNKLSKFSEEHKVVGVHAFTLESRFTASCRNFAPLYGINEEAATGTSNGALTYYLYKNNIVFENVDNIFIQGEKMNRPSLISSKILNENNQIKVLVGGTSKILMKGDFYI